MTATVCIKYSSNDIDPIKVKNFFKGINPTLKHIKLTPNIKTIKFRKSKGVFIYVYLDPS